MTATLADERRDVALAQLEQIVDPCSAGAGEPIGLVSMGIVERVEVHDEEVLVRLLPTFGGCLFVGIFEAEARKRLLALDWCRSVVVEQVSIREGVWTEERMAPAAQARLARRRAAARRELADASTAHKTHARPARAAG